MLEFFSRLKHKISRKLKTSNIKKQTIYSNILTRRNYELNPIHMSFSDSEPEAEPEAVAPEHSSTQIKMFSTIINKKDIEFDNVLIDLKQIILDKNIIIDDLELDEIFEQELSLCCDNYMKNIPETNMDIFKIKMRFFYVIIANNLYHRLFEVKKQYEISDDDIHLHHGGVYSYDKYIIRIDNSHHCFESEKNVIDKIKISESIDNNIIVPFFMHIEHTSHTNITSTNTTTVVEHVMTYSEHLKQIFKTSNLSFSIQPYIKNAESLLYWVKDNIANNQPMLSMSEIRKTFIIHLFYKWACLIEKLHSHDIVHGDIKPDNILIKELDNFNISHSKNYKNFEVYLIDFGLSGIDKKDNGTGGTTPYCHPEFQNIRDSKHTDNYKWKIIHKKHDVWSLGLAFITIYMLGKFNSYYYKYPNYFFTKDGYISNFVFDSISNHYIRELFKDILSFDSISIDEVKSRLLVLIDV
jgi:hypothetical protein